MSSGADRHRVGVAGGVGFVVFVLAAMLAAPSLSEAQQRTVTKVNYYTINGKTARDLDQQMTARGPWHGRARAYANIVAKPDYSGELVQGSNCRLENFTVTAEFTMTLPKLASTKGLSRDLLKRWKSFQTFVRRHEDGHRRIWIDSMRKAERQISGLRAPTCPQLQAKVDQAFAEAWSRAEQRQIAFDRAEQTKLMRHPLIAAATRVDRRKARAIRGAQPVSARAAQRARRASRMTDSQ